MYSAKEVREAFKLMGLLSAKERELFQKMLAIEEDSEQQYLFIRTSGHSKTEVMEAENARLE